ncbi:DUF4268 domain-containing protein [Phycicoccus sp. MAQZ13P-2]|uniref:DUF4268 domain-containing protein n=1 Tax=Phycicoccus mangrovi TaxID=2840470 RepID=UPI001BFFF497|nr:DUF4268 domain-containing protein [Phycicoccus mangrovi]MBT9273626.1 DUF4268 domain-containing protein [Phycicoccus mangrovi]
MTAGSPSAAYYTTFTRRGLSSELVFESPDAASNTARLHTLRAKAQLIEDHYAGALDWQELPGRKSTRVAEYLPGADVTLEENWDEYLAWLLDRQTRLRSAIAAAGGVPQP